MSDKYVFKVHNAYAVDTIKDAYRLSVTAYEVTSVSKFPLFYIGPFDHKHIKATFIDYMNDLGIKVFSIEGMNAINLYSKEDVDYLLTMNKLS